MEITDQTYHFLDVLKTTYSNAEIRIENNRANLYINRKVVCWAGGNSGHVNAFLSGYMYARIMDAKDLKEKLKKL